MKLFASIVTASPSSQSLKAGGEKNVAHFEGLRQNIWGNRSTWGRIANPAPRIDR